MPLAPDSARLRGSRFSDENVAFPTPETAIATKNVVLRLATEEGGRQVGSFNSPTWVKKDGRWLVVALSEAPIACDHGEAPEQERNWRARQDSNLWPSVP